MTAGMVISVRLTGNDDLACAGFCVLPLTYFSGARLKIYFPLVTLKPDNDEVYLNSDHSL